MSKRLVEIYRFETDGGEGAFGNGRANVRRYFPSNEGNPYSRLVHNPGPYDDRLIDDPYRTLSGVERTTHPWKFGFFDLNQARHWFGSPEIIKDMYDEERGSWRGDPTPLRRYAVSADWINRAYHQVTFNRQRASLIQTYTLDDALDLLLKDVPPAEHCTLCP